MKYPRKEESYSRRKAVKDGRVERHRDENLDSEEAKIASYLAQLIRLIPFVPKNKYLTDMDIIDLTIDYIKFLNSALEDHVELSYLVDISNITSWGNHSNLNPALEESPRQPLGVLPPGPNENQPATDSPLSDNLPIQLSNNIKEETTSEVETINRTLPPS